jgi:membrane protease YdiL (CAAX protease family)
MLISAPRNLQAVAAVEIAAMVAILLSFIWGWQGSFGGATGLILVLYFGVGILSHARRGESAWQLGLRVDNLTRALRVAAAFVAPALLVLLAIGFALDSLHFSWSQTTKSLPWLVAWGTAQQYGLLCFFYRRFVEIFGGPWAATASASATFATFHAPNGFLFAVTLAAGVAACTLYRRAPNVFAIGIAHAVISFALMHSLPYDVTHGLHVGPGYLALR